MEQTLRMIDCVSLSSFVFATTYVGRRSRHHPQRRNWYPDGYRRLAIQIVRFQGRAQPSPPRTEQLVARNRSILLRRKASSRLGEQRRELIAQRSTAPSTALWLGIRNAFSRGGFCRAKRRRVKHEQPNDLRRTAPAASARSDGRTGKHHLRHSAKARRFRRTEPQRPCR